MHAKGFPTPALHAREAPCQLTLNTRASWWVLGSDGGFFMDLNNKGYHDGMKWIASSAGPSSTRILGDFQGPSNSNETCCVLNHQRGLTLPRPTAGPTATRPAYL